jgi:hypothetical protein
MKRFIILPIILASLVLADEAPTPASNSPKSPAARNAIAKATDQIGAASAAYKESVAKIRRQEIADLKVGAKTVAANGDLDEVGRIKAVIDELAGSADGQWRVEFANGVVERCDLQKDATASVIEPGRSSGGTVSVKDGVFVIAFADDRVERWTRVGQRMVVEHWFPGSQYPSGKPVLGIAERTISPPETPSGQR